VGILSRGMSLRKLTRGSRSPEPFRVLWEQATEKTKQNSPVHFKQPRNVPEVLTAGQCVWGVLGIRQPGVCPRLHLSCALCILQAHATPSLILCQPDKKLLSAPNQLCWLVYLKSGFCRSSGCLHKYPCHQAGRQAGRQVACAPVFRTFRVFLMTLSKNLLLDLRSLQLITRVPRKTASTTDSQCLL
jgi:hypothetical protein